MVSVSHIGAQDLTADKTSPNPAITKINPLIEDIIKAITWFLVSVDKHIVCTKTITENVVYYV